MNKSPTLKVAIDARARQGLGGGVAQAVMSLVCSLGRLDDGPETYTIIVGSEEQLELLKPLSGPNQTLLLKAKPKRGHVDRTLAVKRLLRPIGRRIRSMIAPESPRRWPEVDVSDGYYEALGCNLIHFLTQHFTLCALPSVYNPHDLQHLHFPQFWDPWSIAFRETVYPAGCRIATTVVVGSNWIKEDVVRQYGISPDKVQIIPEGPAPHFFPIPSPEELESVKNRYNLPQPFILYPAVTWPHKNHLRLIEAIACARDIHGLSVNLVCTGSRYRPFWPQVEQCIEEFGCQSQVRFLGFVPDQDLQALYRLSQFLIMPTLFEASSLPIFEAWQNDAPVACANVTALPDQVGDAALMFDPTNIESISTAITSLARSEKLRETLRERGRRRLLDFDCDRTARAYRAVYRRAARFPLTEDDRWLLNWDWMRQNHIATNNELAGVAVAGGESGIKEPQHMRTT